MVRLERVERSASAVSEQRSAAELKTRGAPGLVLHDGLEPPNVGV